MPLRATFPAGPPLGLADLVLRPWFDRIALHAVAQWYFPLSRGWAAAIESGGEVEAFVRSIGGVRLPRPQVQSILDFALGRHHAYERIASGWKHAFFDPAAPRPVAGRPRPELQ